MPKSSQNEIDKPSRDEVGRRAGVQIGFRTAPDIPTFEGRLAAGE